IFIISPSIKNTFTAPPVLKFVVTGIFETGLSAIDGGLCYISTKSAQKLFRMKGKVNRISLIVDNPDNATSISNVINDKLPFPYLTRSWIEENKNLYFWIAMEKLMMTFVLSLIVLIAAFNIISSLIMLVMEKRREIGVLTAVGFSPDKVMRVFMYQGMILGVIGTVLGVILGLLVCFIQKEFSIITLPGDVYIIDALPILVDSTDVLVSVAVSMGLSYLATLYPSYRASKLKPVDVIRND
ncbi:MAG: lipoprotein-releasing system transmembrane subunit LolC, partial [Candidatus Delongbacteria bacterium]